MREHYERLDGRTWHELIGIAVQLEAELKEAKTDSERLDTVLSWHGVNWFFAWFQDAENTTPPTRDDIDKIRERH